MKLILAGFNKNHERINKRCTKYSGRMCHTIDGVKWLSLDSFRIFVEAEWLNNDGLKYGQQAVHVKDIKK